MTIRRYRADQYRAVDNNKIKLLRQAGQFFRGNLPDDADAPSISHAELIGDRRDAALDMIESVKARWEWIIDNLDAAFEMYTTRLSGCAAGKGSGAEETPQSVFHALRDFVLRVSWKREVLASWSSCSRARPTSRSSRPTRFIRRSCAAVLCCAAHARRRR